MVKLPALTPKEIIKIIEQKGFVLDRIKGSHYIYINTENKRRIIVPFHRKDLPVGTLKSILKQAGLTEQELKDIFN